MTYPSRDTHDNTSTVSNVVHWGTAPTSKTRNMVQRSVISLLDTLAPERVVKRTDDPPAPIEQHRTPSGCVLQAPQCAVSVSWFPAGAREETQLGELHVLVWSGKVARRGVPQSLKKPTLLSELVLRPIEPPVDHFIWRSIEGARYDTSSLATHVRSLLDCQIQNASV
jgi:hypothetical protein